jgi:DNA-binding response OmpR family regulator
MQDPMQILVADDDPVIRSVLQAMLVHWGYRPLMAADGEEAWRILQRSDAPKLAILDWLMPDMNGIEICRRVRVTESAEHIHIVLLTANTRDEDLLEALEVGADDYLPKPFRASELRARLQAGRRIVEMAAPTAA